MGQARERMAEAMRDDQLFMRSVTQRDRLGESRERAAALARNRLMVQSSQGLKT
jgi:putative protein kinase ArgK-like GTPase of G3E family